MERREYSVAINAYPGKGEAAVLFAGHEPTLPGHHVGPQVLDYHLVHYVVSGTGTFRCLGKLYKLSAGDCFFIFPGELVSYTADETDPWSYRWMGLQGQELDRMLAVCGITAYHPVVRNMRDRGLDALFRKAEDTLRVGTPADDLRAGAIFRLALAEWMPDKTPARPDSDREEDEDLLPVNKAIRYLTLHYSQSVSIDRMASSLGYHRSHLSKLFKRHTGMSPMAFLLNLRMEKAKLLLHKTLTIEQVASAVGFPDPLYFSKQFKKHFGCSPSEYRGGNRGRTK